MSYAITAELPGIGRVWVDAKTGLVGTRLHRRAIEPIKACAESRMFGLPIMNRHCYGQDADLVRTMRVVDIAAFQPDIVED